MAKSNATEGLLGEQEEKQGQLSVGGTVDNARASSRTLSAKKKKKKKGASNKSGPSESASSSKSSMRFKRKGKSKGKKKKKKKTKGSKGSSKSKETSSEPDSDVVQQKFTDEDVQNYLRRKEARKAKQRLQHMVHRMKELISIVPSNDPRWNVWTEYALYNFLRFPESEVVTVYLEKPEVEQDDQALFWGDDVPDQTNQTQEEASNLEDTSIPQSVTVTPTESQAYKSQSKVPVINVQSKPTNGPYSITEEEITVPIPQGPEPPVPKGMGRLVAVNEVVPNKYPMFYFVKVANNVVDHRNFFENVHYGFIGKEGYLPSMKGLLDCVFDKAFFKSHALPESIKNEFAASFDKVMGSVTEAHYKLEAQTVLFVPSEAINLPIDIASKDKELCNRLEVSMVHWNRQIKELLANHMIHDVEDWALPLDEIDFWRTRFYSLFEPLYTGDDLKGLAEQVRSLPVRTVQEIMTIIKSPFLHQFESASGEILGASAESISNLHYLSALKETCEILHNSSVKDIPDQMKNIFWLVRVIWLQSPYYNTHERLNGLLRKFSNEIIRICSLEVEVDNVFRGHVESAEMTIKSSLECLHMWKTKYFEAQKMHHMYSKLTWQLEYERIFTHVDAFIHRLKDLLELCTCQRLYARRTEGHSKPLPTYPTSKSREITKTMVEVQKIFERQLKMLYVQKHLILDMVSTKWYEHMLPFRIRIKDMEILLQNMMVSAFDSVTNLVEGIDLLELFFVFYQRDIISRAYDKLVVHLYRILEKETILVRQLFAKNILPLNLIHPMYAGKAAWAQYLKRRLEIQLDMLQGAWWLPECGYGDDVRDQAQVLSKSLQDFTVSMYTQWLKELGTKDLRTKLDVPLMIRSVNQQFMLDINFDKFLHKHIVEAEIWSRLDFKIPNVIHHPFDLREKLHHMRETVLDIVKDYNKIIAGLNLEERLMFRERIKVLDRKVKSGMNKLMWSSNVSDAYVNDCKVTAAKVESQTKEYKSVNDKIAKLTMKMSNRPMIAGEPKEVFDGLEFNQWQRTYRERAVIKIATNYKKITLLLVATYEMFREDGSEVRKQWIKYLKTVDQVVEEAFTINFRRSLEILSRAIHGDMRGPPSPLFRINIILDQGKLGFSPNLTQVQDMILGIYKRICGCFKLMPRVVQFLGDRRAKVSPFSYVLAIDEVAQKTQDHVSQGYIDCILEVDKYMKTWEPIRDVWEVDKDEFMRRYEAMSPTVQNYDTDITRYSNVISNVHGQESLIHVGFCIIDCDKLKHAIEQHCYQWQKRLMQPLFEKANSTLTQIFEYMITSIHGFRSPSTIAELVSTTQRFQTILAEIPVMEKSFPLMKEQFAVLKKHEFGMDDKTTQRVLHFNESWHNYLIKLKEIASMLKKYKERFRKLSDPEVFGGPLKY